MRQEKQPSNIESKLDQVELEQVANERLRDKAERLEQRSPEKSSAERADKSRHEALEQAKSTETDKQLEKHTNTAESRPDAPPNSKVARKRAYDSIMNDVQTQMSPVERGFSKFIHVPAVEKASDVAGSTVARPNAILAGSLSAFILVLGVYLVARYYGYPLSGTETMVAFAAGWVLGVVFDFLRLMITGRHN